jgi:ABC-type transporter Mla MlaB component
MAEVDANALLLPARVDVTTAAALFKRHLPRCATLERIDFAAVEHLDSAGVAMVHALQAEQRRRGAKSARLTSLPSRFAQLCQAHRIDPGVDS